MPPNGELMAALEGYPEGLLAIPNDDGSPRIIVPKSQIKSLVLQCHEDIHHQSHVKVLYILKPLYYWPGMHDSIKRLCTACQTCMYNRVGKAKASESKVRPALSAINNATQTRLWDRFLRNFQRRNISHG